MSVNPLPVVAQGLRDAWDGATKAIHDRVTNPVDSLQAMGDYSADLAQDAWDDLRQTYRDAGNTINLVTDVIETPCEDKWSVLVETALPAAGDALMMLVVPSPDEVAENYLQPKSARSGGRGGRDTKRVRRRRGASGKLRRYWPRVPDPDQLVATILPGQEAVAGRDAGNAQRFLFGAIDRADAVLWHWLVIDATGEFFYQWSSNIMESRFCTQPHDAIFNATKPRRDGPDLQLTDWEVDQAKNVEYDVNSVTSLNPHDLRAGFQSGTLIVNMSLIRASTGSETEATIWVEANDYNGHEQDRIEVTGTTSDDGNQAVTLEGTLNLAGVYSLIFLENHTGGDGYWDHEIETFFLTASYGQ